MVDMGDNLAYKWRAAIASLETANHGQGTNARGVRINVSR